MPAPSDYPPDATTPSASDSQGGIQPQQGMASIDAPEANKTGTDLKLEARSVKTVAHALSICTATEVNNRTRAARTADMQALHDGQPPRSASANLDKGKSWQSNASTGWMSGIVGRVAQRFVNSVISQIYVSSSALPDSVEENKRKTDLMRSKFTQLIRAWDGYTGIINALTVETVLQGYTYAVFLDPYTYKPRMFKQDHAFVPEKSGMHARDIQFFVAKMDYKVYDFLKLFTDKDGNVDESTARDVGYDIDNCVKAAAQAVMDDPRGDATTTQFRKLVDMVDEGTLGLSFVSSTERVVQTWLLFNQEYDGKISFWLIERNTGRLLRFSFKLFKCMEDVMTMFSFEPGNGCIHSSKGLGRKLANLAVMKELFRNGIIDNSRMSGLMILRADSKDRTKFSPAVLSPFIVLDKSVEIPEQQFQANSESYKITDSLIDTWAEQTVGAYLPSQIVDEDKTEKTATQATIDARREMESADIQIRRFLDQFAGMTQIQQQRAFSDEYLKEARDLFNKISEDPEKDDSELYEGHSYMDPLALRTLVEIMQAGITDDEIRQWRESPTSILAHVSDRAIQQGIAAVKQNMPASPNIDYSKLDYLVIEGLVGAEVAKQIYIPQANETSLAEGSRQQLMETATMSTSQIPLPVSLRDPHLIHGETIQKLLTAIAPALSSPQADDKVLKNTEMNLNHLGEHLKALTQLGQGTTPAFKELDKFYEGFKGQFAQVLQIRAETTAAVAAAVQKVQTEGLPPPDGAAAPAPEGALPPALDNAGTPGIPDLTAGTRRNPGSTASPALAA